jgi:WD40 repeat protein
MAVAPDGRWAAAAYSDRTVRLWDLTTGALRHVLRGHEKEVCALAFSPDGDLLVSGGQEGCVLLWDVENGHLRERLPYQMLQGRHAGLTSIAFFPDGRRIVWGLHSGHAVVWDLAAKRPCLELAPAAETWGGEVALSPDGRILAVGRAAELHFYNADGGESVRVMKGVSPISLHFSRDGTLLVVGDDVGAGMKLLDVPSGERRLGIVVPEDCLEVALSPDNRTILAGSHYDRGVFLYDVASGVRIRTLTGHHAALRAVTFLPDGRKCLSASADGSLRLWDVGSGHALATMLVLPATDGAEVPVDWITFTPEGAFIGSPNVGRFIRWRVGEEVWPFNPCAEQFQRPEDIHRVFTSGEGRRA